MGQLFFKKHFQDAIRAGRKQTTIRRWKRPMVAPGGRAFSPGLGWLEIGAVEVVELEKLSAADAQADGFETTTALREVLLAFYPNHAKDGKKWFRVGFKLAGEAGIRDGKKAQQPRLLF
jgi:hypothetical protein